VVDARFAGGPILVSTAELPATGMQTVSVKGPAFDFPLEPDEARRLATALLQAAGYAEREEATTWP
jgi:hypothetical protein